MIHWWQHLTFSHAAVVLLLAIAAVLGLIRRRRPRNRRILRT